MAKKIAFYSEKGGVGKTFLSVTTAHALAIAGQNVLLFDMDAHLHATRNFGLKPEEYEQTLLSYVTDPKKVDYSKLIKTGRQEENGKVDVIANNDNEGFIAYQNMVSLSSPLNYYFEDRFKEFDKMYDYIIIDCTPTASNLLHAILYYVDNVVVPVELKTEAVEGIPALFNTLNKLRLSYSKIKAIIPNKYEHTNSNKDNHSFLEENFPNLLTPIISNRVKYSEAYAERQTAWEYIKEKELIETLEAVVRKIVLEAN